MKFIYLCMFLILSTLGSVIQAQTQIDALTRIQDETGFVSKLGENKAGIEFKQRSGMPGEGVDIVLRGVKSLFGATKPLIIVDGMIFDDSGFESPLITGSYLSGLSAINGHEILKINVLQGADALKYGALGANGVLEITTKFPDLFETSIEISSQVGIVSLARQLEQMDADQFRNYAMDVLSTGFTSSEIMDEFGYPGLFVQPGDLDYHTYNHNTNWQDEIFESAFTNRNNIQIKAGDDIAKYFLTMGYSKTNGIVRNTSEEIYNVRLNSEIAVHKKVLVSLGLAFNESNSDLVETAFSFNNNPIASALAKSPLLGPIRKDAEGVEQNAYDFVREFEVSNPVAIINVSDANSKTTTLFANTKIAMKLSNRLNVDVYGGLSVMKNNQSNFVAGMDGTLQPSITNGVLAQNSVKRGAYELRTFEGGGDVRYNLLDSESDVLDVATGFKYYQSEMYNNYAVGINTNGDQFKTLKSINSIYRLLSGSSLLNKMFEYKVDLSYSFKDFVSVILNVNYNGVNNVGINVDKFSLNGGGQIAFNAGQVLGVESTDILSKLKLNLGYGRFSPNNIPFAAINSYYHGKVFDDVGSLVRVNLGNDQLERETVDKMNVGLGFGLFGDILDVDVNYFNDESNNLVMAIPVEEFTGFSRTHDNVGSMTNKGFTVFVKANVINTKDLAWSLGVDFTTYKNEIKSLDGGSLITSTYGCDLITEEGGSAYQFYGFKSTGIIHDDDDDTDILRNKVGEKYVAGDMRYKDVDGDGYINEKDRVVIGNPNPDYFGNMFTSLRYKDFSFSLNVKYNVGGDIFNYQRSRNEGQVRAYNQSVAVEGRYRDFSLPYNTVRPKYSKSETIDFSDRWIEDGSYVKLSDVTLSYNFKNIYKQIGALVYVQGQNLLVGTNYLGYDPEFQYGDQVMNRGIDCGQMPMGRTILFGVKLSL